MTTSTNWNGLKFAGYLEQYLYPERYFPNLCDGGILWPSTHLVHNSVYNAFGALPLNPQNTNRGKTPAGVFPANSTATFISNFLWTNVSGTINTLLQVVSFIVFLFRWLTVFETAPEMEAVLPTLAVRSALTNDWWRLQRYRYRVFRRRCKLLARNYVAVVEVSRIFARQSCR